MLLVEANVSINQMNQSFNQNKNQAIISTHDAKTCKEYEHMVINKINIPYLDNPNVQVMDNRLKVDHVFIWEYVFFNDHCGVSTVWSMEISLGDDALYKLIFTDLHVQAGSFPVQPQFSDTGPVWS